MLAVEVRDEVGRGVLKAVLVFEVYTLVDD
jgi:hypothetical protein